MSSSPVTVVVPKGIRAVRVVGDVDLLYSTAPMDPASGAIVPIGAAEYFLVHEGETVQVVARSAAGTANIAFLTR